LAIGTTLAHDLKLAAKQLPQDAPFRRFWMWLINDKHASSAEMLSMYDCGLWPTMGPQAAALKVAAVIESYIAEYRDRFRRDWSRRTQALLAKGLVWMGNLSSKRYPLFDISLLPIRSGSVRQAVSLGGLDWPELMGIRPAERDEVALELVQQDALKVLDEAERTYKFGISALTLLSPPRNVGLESWWRIKHYLQSARADLLAGERLVDGGVSGVNHPSTWIDAGFPLPLGDAYLEVFEVRELAARCLGATNRVTAAMKAYFCTVTSWNREQINLLPRDPYAFRYEDAAGICQAAFLSEFKARAGHFVSTHLERRTRSQQVTKEQNLSIWAEVSTTAAENSQGSIIEIPSALDVLDRYAKLTVPVRDFDVNATFADRFFISIGQRGLSGTDVNLREYKLTPLLNRPEVNYRTIRQSCINIARRATGSIANQPPSCRPRQLNRDLDPLR
jgi:hypothetical protein